MTANLFGERFYGNRKPAWHGLGVTGADLTAQEAFSSITPYDVELKPLFLEGGVPIENQAIVRTPVPDDPIERVFGVVGKDYTLTSPMEVCRIFDERVNHPVETIGALGMGETFFLTCQLPIFDVMGDEVENYMLVVSPYTGWSAIQVRVTPVRVVCQNTLVAAKSASSEVYRIIHNEQADNRLRAWMGQVYQKALDRSKTLTQAFEMFAQYQPRGTTVDSILGKIYPEPKAPGSNLPDELKDARALEYEYAVKSATRSREAVTELFNGKATGADVPAFKGTGWGLYNSVVEWEDYRPTTREESRGANALFGDRASVKERAFKVVQEYVTAAAKRSNKA